MIEPSSLQPGMIPLPFADGDAVAAQVLWVDRFGNAQLNVGPDDVEHLGDRLRLVMGERTRLARRATSYAELGADVGLVLDSYGLLAVSLDRHSAVGRPRPGRWRRGQDRGVGRRRRADRRRRPRGGGHQSGPPVRPATLAVLAALLLAIFLAAVVQLFFLADRGEDAPEEQGRSSSSSPRRSGGPG